MGGTLGSGPSRAQSPPPGQHAYNVLPYSPSTHYVYRASRCKCEIVKCQLICLCTHTAHWKQILRKIHMHTNIKKRSRKSYVPQFKFDKLWPNATQWTCCIQTTCMACSTPWTWSRLVAPNHIPGAPPTLHILHVSFVWHTHFRS